MSLKDQTTSTCPEIPEHVRNHPAWKRVWDVLLTPRDDIKKPATDEQAA